jgi:hypothetical protein
MLLPTTQPAKSKSAINPSIVLLLPPPAATKITQSPLKYSSIMLHLHSCSSPLLLHLHSCSSPLLLRLHSCSSPPLLLHLQITTVAAPSAAHHRCCSI